MSESATVQRQRATANRITHCAQLLTDEHGLDGFTMDDLAEEAGVSRRTLFNYFDGKIEAVLGRWRLDEELVDRFVAGGPDGDLVRDLHALVAGILAGDYGDRESLARGKRILLGNPRLLTAVHTRYLEMSEDVVGYVVVREGTGFSPQRARVAIRLLAALLDAAFDQFLDDPAERPIAAHFEETLLAARGLLG